MADSLSLLRGTLDILVLKALSWEPMHGFEITSWLEQRSGGDLAIDDGALYHALHRMEERDWIASEWRLTENNRRARYYKLRPAGKKHLTGEAVVLRRYAQMLTAILDAKTA